jgi:hypothetical protein
MSTGIQSLDAYVQPAGFHGVYAVPMQHFDLDALPATIGGRPITAIAPHPRNEDLLYVTTEHPETLAFLPDPYVDLRDEALRSPRHQRQASSAPPPVPR